MTFLLYLPEPISVPQNVIRLTAVKIHFMENEIYPRLFDCTAKCYIHVLNGFVGCLFGYSLGSCRWKF